MDMPDVIYAAWSDHSVGCALPWGLWMPIDYYQDNIKYISEAKHQETLAELERRLNKAAHESDMFTMQMEQDLAKLIKTTIKDIRGE